MRYVEGHRKNIKHKHELGDFHEFTFSCFRRMPLLTNDEWLRKLSASIDAAGIEYRFDLVAFVFMPEHVHLLTFPRDPEPDFGGYLGKVKKPVSSHVKNVLRFAKSPMLEKLTVAERPGKKCFRFWQEGPGYDRNVSRSQPIQTVLDYIHNNPVKRTLCEHAIDWKWSSARYYVLEPPKQQFEDLPHVHGLTWESLEA